MTNLRLLRGEVFSKATLIPVGTSIIRTTHPFRYSLDCWYRGWYLHEGNIGGELSSLLVDIRKVLDFHALSGLALNAGKCESFFNTTADEEAHMFYEIST